MKVLLDECLPLDFQHSFPQHEAHTAKWTFFLSFSPARKTLQPLANQISKALEAIERGQVVRVPKFD